MDRRAAGALLALAACIASSAAAPTAGNHTALDLYEGAPEGCYYNFQHYGEGDRIMTNEPCLNCTCHNRMLMCYLRVCPFTKPIGQDCTVEKRADQCCPIITCPDVPVDLLTSTSTSSPAEYGATGLGKLDKYGCSISGKYFPEGSKVPPTPNKPCEHCYCIRNMTTCVMQECTLHVDGCTPIYHKDVCCPIRYSCDHAEDEVPLLDDMSTTVRPTPGFLLTTTTVSPVTQMTQDCVHNDQIIADGASITTEKACEHCYCMKGDIVCVVQECGAPMENEGKNCTSLPPRDGQCCPDTYICEGDELSTEILTDFTTDTILEKITTLSPPRRSGDEGSGYRNEPNEATYTEIPSTESPLEGSGEELEPTKPVDEYEALTPEQPSDSEKVTPNVEESGQDLPVTTEAPVYKEIESSTTEIDKNLIPDSFDKETTKPQLSIPDMPIEDISGVNTGLNLPDEHITTTGTAIPASFDQFTTELIESLNTVPDVSPEKEQEMIHHEYNTEKPELEKTEPALPQTNVETKTTSSAKDQDVTLNPISEFTAEPEYLTPNPEISDEKDQYITEKPLVDEQLPQKGWYPERDGSTVTEEIQTISPEKHETTVSDKEIDKPDSFTPSTTNTPVQEIEKLTTELNNAQNTVVVAEEDNQYPHITTPKQTEKATVSDLDDIVTEKSTKVDVLEPEEHVSTVESVLKESETTAEPDKGLNTIPSETDEHSHPETSPLDVTTSSAIKTTESPITIDRTNLPKTEESPTSTPILESHVTKVDLYTVTTEPSFRKEDESNISTEKTREEIGSTTIKAEFVDEGLIPTSGQDDKLSTGSNIPFTDEDITTIIPEFNKEPEEPVTTKLPATDSLPETVGSSETLPEKIAETTDETESHLPASTEKSVDATVLPEIHEEPSRIPGEGDCLLNGVTYRNNSVVPSTNNCLTGCKCVSSIVKCDPIICSPPPDYMSNCQSIFDTPDSCCPTYICDHPRETIPPQSDNQMSGTEPPVILPTIECRGDQCELSVPTKPTEPSEPCTSDSCLSAPAAETGTKECGPDGCADSGKESVSLQPSTEQSECTDGKCKPPVEDCVNGKCQLSPTHSLPPTKPCDGDDCKTPVAELPDSQLCEDGHDCKEIEVPVTQTVTNVNCENNDCEPSIISQSQDKQPVPCNENDGCKPEEIAPLDCTGEEPCRRKDSSVAEKLPPKCEGSDCAQNTDKLVTQNIDKLSTDSPISEETPLNEVTGPILTDSPILDQEEVKTTPTIQSITEQQYVPTEHTIHEKTDMSEKTPEIQETITNQPSLVEKEGTKRPDIIESYTDTPVPIENIITTKADDTTKDTETPNLIDHQGTQMPDLGISKPSPDLKQETTLPVESDQEVPDKQPPSEEDVTQIPIVTDEYTHKSTDESGTKISDVTEEEPTKVDGENNVPNIVDEYTEEPLITEEFTTAPGHVTKYTDIPHAIENQETKIPDIIDKIPVTSVEGEITKVPEVTEEYSNIQTEVPIIVKEHPDEANKIEEPSTKTPDIIEKDTEKPIFVTEKDSKIPEDEKEPVDKLSQVEEESTRVPIVTDDYYKPTETPNIIKDSTQKVTSVDESHTESSGDIDEQSYVPVFVAEDGTEAPDFGQEHSDKPTATEGLASKIPDSIEKEPNDELIPTKEETTKPPEITEDYTDEPTKLTNIPDEPSKIPAEETAEPTITPDIIKEQTDEPVRVQDSDTTLTSIKEEHTQMPGFVTEESTKTPYYGGDHVDETPSLEEDDSNKKKPTLPVEELPEKPIDMKETPEFIEKEVISEPAITGEDGTENPKAVEDSSTVKTMLTEEPAVVEMQGSTGDLPIMTEETSTDKVKETDDRPKDRPSINQEVSDKPEVVMEHYTPAFVETDKTDKSEILDEQTITSESPEHIPQTSDDNQSGTTAPQIYFTESDKEVKLPESSIKEHPETVDKDIEKVTQVPTYESQTTESEGLQTESHLKDNEINKSEVISPQDTATSSDANELESLTKEPYHYSSTDAQYEVTTEFITKLEKASEVPVAVSISENTLPPMHEEGLITSYQEPLTNKHEATEKPEMIITTESVEKITKTMEHVISNEPEEGYTGIPEQIPSVTKSPAEVIIEPQEGELPESPDVSQTNPADVETATKVFEDNIKTTAPESHISDSLPEYESTSKLPETDRVTDVASSETQKPPLPEQHEGELESIPTKTPAPEKTEQPEVYTPEQEEMITTTIDSTGTLAPMKGSSEIDDSLITNEVQSTTGYNADTTERVSESSESLSSKTTKLPEESYTKLHEEFTEAPIYEASTTSKSPVPVQETPDSDKPISGEPDRRNEMPELEKTTPQATELPVALVTDSDDKLTGPVGDTIVPEEKTTKTPDYVHSDVSTILPETYVTDEPVVTRIPEPNEPATPEQIKTTESSNIDTKVIDDQETGIKPNVPEVIDAQKTTIVPELTDTLGPQTDTEVQKSSTESPVSLQVHTDLPLTQATPEASLSLVTEYQPDSVTVEKQDHTEAVLQDSYTVAPEKTTEREDVATSLHETTTVKQLDITIPAEKTSAEVELTETTPYLTELEEHTHKITDDSSTVLSVEEKVPISESGEVSYTSTPSQEEQHTPAPDVMTPSGSEEEHTVKVEEDHSTVSSSTEDYTHKIPEDTSVLSPSIEEATTEKEPQDSEKITEKAPEKDLEITTKQSEILSSSTEETSSISEEMSHQTTLSVPKDADTDIKPLQEQTTEEPLNVEDSGVTQKDITTSKQSQDFESTTPVTFTDTEKAPISEADIKVPTKEESSYQHLPDSSDKTTASEDESLSSTPKTTTVKQEEMLTPSSEDKYNPPEDKPSSEAILPNPTAEVPKPSTEIEPTEEIPAPEEEPSSSGGYGEPDYTEEDQAFGPGTCRYGGKVYVSAQQIPRDDPCDFCFCFRSDIICLQQSCPPPIHGCHEEPIQGFCCPRYECPVSMATTVNVTTTTTTTTTTLPPHFPTHGYKGAAQRRGCQIKGHTYKVGEVVRSSSGPCLHCTCGGDGQMKCDPKACTPEPMLRQMIAAAVSAKRRR